MHDANWWLMAFAFLLGLLLTFAFTIRRVKREVPVYAALGRGPGVQAATVTSSKAGDEPYGKGSLRLAPGAVVPSGYNVKGDEESMRYHTKDSPLYKQTAAELWFWDAASAQRAGFARWDKDLE